MHNHKSPVEGKAFKSDVHRYHGQYLLVDVASHWVFQSMIFADATERYFKLFLDLVLTILFGAFLSQYLSLGFAWGIAFLAAHTLNFLLNGQLSNLVKNHGLQDTSYEELEGYIDRLRTRASSEPAIRRIVIVGSLSADDWTSSSDLDIRILRNAGFVNGIRSGWFLLRERSYALIHWFPLDAYLLDSEVPLVKTVRSDETVIDLLAYKQTDVKTPNTYRDEQIR